VQYWLFKSEPNTYSWDHLLKEKETDWDGVRNYQAANNMKAMKKGDLGFFYHSVVMRKIVGIVEVTQTYRPDPSDETGRFGMVSVKPIKPLPNPVSLAEIKNHPALFDLSLVKQSRLSVMPIPEQAWYIMCEMGGILE